MLTTDNQPEVHKWLNI